MIFLKKEKINFFILLFCLIFLFGFQSTSQQQFLTEDDLNRLDPRLQGAVMPYMTGLRKAAAPTIVKSVAQKADGTKVYSVVVYTEDVAALLDANLKINSIYPHFATGRFTPAELAVLANIEAVKYIDAGELYYPTNDLAAGAVGCDLVKGGYVNNTEYKGSGVIVCIIDTGIDWEHEDFRDPADPTQSRILYVWDQTLTASGGETTPEDRDGTNYAGLNYGVEYSNSQIEDEIDGSPAGFVRESDTNGHGTHVAGTAAGNGASLSTLKYQGMAPEADLLIVKAGNGSFPTGNLIDALSYVQQVATEQGKAIVVNMSLGGHANAHDGTRSLDVAVDDFAGTGQVAVISAGNEGDNAIHITGSVGSSSSTDIYFTVPSYSPNSGTDNDYFGFDLWFDTGGDVTSQFTTPNTYTASQTAGGSGTTQTNDGAIYFYNYIDGNNSDREVYTEVYDYDASYPPEVGTWTLNIQNNSGTSMTYHGWLFVSTMGASLNSGDTDYTVGSPGTANEAITVGSYVSRWRWSDYNGDSWWYGSADLSDDISAFSSIGPTRDGRQKPDITAPGQGIASSTSSDCTPATSRILPGLKHHLNQGTSMSCPVTTGCAALLLEINPSLDASQVKSLITSTAMTDDYTGGSLPDYTWGYGKLDIFRAAAKAFYSGSTKEREILAYDDWAGNNDYVPVDPDLKVAVRFTPTISCQVTGFFIHTGFTVDLTGPLYAAIWSDDDSGLPYAKLGDSVAVDQNAILPFSWNFIDMTDAGVTVSHSTDYHAVIYYTSGTEFDLHYDKDIINDRSSYNFGSGWVAGSGDLRIRTVVSSEPGALLVTKIFLEGPYYADGDTMSTILGPDNYDVIPLTSPYSEDPRTVTAIPKNVTDWILVQLRTSKTGSAVASKSAFLHRNGDIVADDGTSNQILFDIGAGDYFVVIKHRTHLSVMSDETISLTSPGSTLYDFTTGTDKYEGADAAFLETGVYGLYAGDVSNDDAIILATEATQIQADNLQAGYYNADVNMDGAVVQATEITIVQRNNLRGSFVP